MQYLTPSTGQKSTDIVAHLRRRRRHFTQVVEIEAVTGEPIIAKKAGTGGGITSPVCFPLHGHLFAKRRAVQRQICRESPATSTTATGVVATRPKPVIEEARDRKQRDADTEADTEPQGQCVRALLGRW